LVSSPQTFRGEDDLHEGGAGVSTELDLLQGTLDLLVLKTLTWGPMHGYAVARWIRETTNDELQVEEGALYTALHRMEKRAWIAAEWGVSENNRKARYYRLTAAGRRQLLGKTAAFERYAQAVFRILRTA
jgi:transcriptional regulator